MSGFDLSKVLGAGTENIDKGVLGMPFVRIIQKGSPEFDESHEDYATKQIANCRPGNIVFAPTRKILPQPILVVPLHIANFYTEWKPEGGFVANRPLTVVSDRGYRRGQPGTPDQYKEWLGSNELMFTIMASILFLNGNEWTKGFISFTSTQLKPGRNWQKSLLGLRYPDTDNQPPIFGSQWKLSSQTESNTKGGWFGWDIRLDRLLDPVADEALLTESYQLFLREQAALPASAPAASIEDKKDIPF